MCPIKFHSLGIVSLLNLDPFDYRSFAIELLGHMGISNVTKCKSSKGMSFKFLSVNINDTFMLTK